MALESVYASLPAVESDPGDPGAHRRLSSVVARGLAYVLVTCTAAATLVLDLAPVFDVKGHPSWSPTPRLQIDGDLSPPILVVKPDMKRLHYCGLDPDNQQTMPRIPPLTDSEYELVQVQAFIRHGARFINAPAKCWPGQERVAYNCSLDELATTGHDLSQRSLSVRRLYRKRYMENRNFFRGDCRLGQLTLKGHRQEVALGNMFRETYGNGALFDPNLGPEQVFVRAHDIPRVVMSAQAFMTGMFPEHSLGDGRSSVVDIWTMDANDDDEVINPHECPGVDLQREQARSSPEYLRHEVTVTALLNDRLSKVVGVPVNELGTNKFDCFFISLCQGDPVPDGVDESLMQALETEARYNLYYMMQYPDRVSGSRLCFFSARLASRTNIGHHLPHISHWNFIAGKASFSSGSYITAMSVRCPSEATKTAWFRWTPWKPI